MGHTLRNEYLTLHWDLPETNYQQSRFDWTGKITQAHYRDLPLLSTELPTGPSNQHGQGLYNEFGFKLPLGFEEIQPGDWFHKIGVGLLQKDDPKYDFLKPLTIRPVDVEVSTYSDKLKSICRAEESHGYAYRLEKTIQLEQHGWSIHYILHNTGKQTIVTNEYTHNFIGLGGQPVDDSYRLSFPFTLHPDTFDETINPEALVRIGEQDIQLLGQPSTPFFFSYMAGSAPVKAQWTLENKRLGIGISESGDFQTQNVCLWGAGHVISPELFIDIHLPAGDTLQWTRQYRIFDL